MIALVHAFSAHNRGDALLVDLAIKWLGETGVAREDVVVVALDPESFQSLNSVSAPGDASNLVSWKVLSSLGSYSLGSVSDLSPRGIEVIRGADAVIGVGGGYLATDGLIPSTGVLVNHLAQLRAAAESPAPTTYLPQTIGPLIGPIGRSVRRMLSEIDCVFVRDDESLVDAGWSGNVQRVADMALLDFARRARALPVVDSGQGSPVLVGRTLGRSQRYNREMRRLGVVLHDAVWATQANIAGRKDDERFYKRIGVASHGSLSSVLLDAPKGVVVSVRLHGALEAIRSGWPAIHLAYGRKGTAAFRDLNLGDYVHSAHEFDADQIAAQVQEIRANPAAYFDLIHNALPSLTQQAGLVVEALRRTVHSG